MLDYNFGDYDELEPKCINKGHMAVLICVDRSGSMYGEAIQNATKSINRFASDVCKDSNAAAVVDVAVVSFNESDQIEQNWRPITEMKPVELVASGGTNLAGALDTGVNMLRERTSLYDEMGIEVKMPYLILITDAKGGDVTEIAEVIKKRTEDHKMQLWVLAVKDYDKATVAKLTNGERVFELVDENGFDFSEFFDLMAVGVKALSTSAPGERVTIKHNIGREGSTCRVPDLDKWVNGNM